MIIPERDVRIFNMSIEKLDDVMADMRRIANNMLPEALLESGLGEAIQNYSDGINESTEIRIKYIEIGSLKTLSQSAEIIIYRIIRELSDYAIKLSRAKHIFIQVNAHQLGFIITVEDDGKGFDGSARDKPEADFQDLKSRVNYLNGSFNMEAGKDEGTSIVIEIPIDN